MTLRADLSSVTSVSDKSALMKETIRNLEARAAMLAKEHLIRQVGEDTINIEIPGTTPLAEVRKVLLTSSKVEFCWARNLVTAKAPSRNFMDIKDPKTGRPIEFQMGNGKVISYELKTGVVNPAYAKLVSEWVVIVGERDIEEVHATNINGKWVPEFRFSEEGGRKMLAWCRANSNRGENLGLVVDGKVVYVAALQNGALIQTHAVMTGIRSAAETREIVEKAGRRPLPLKLTEVDAKEFRP